MFRAGRPSGEHLGILALWLFSVPGAIYTLTVTVQHFRVFATCEEAAVERVALPRSLEVLDAPVSTVGTAFFATVALSAVALIFFRPRLLDALRPALAVLIAAVTFAVAGVWGLGFLGVQPQPPRSALIFVLLSTCALILGAWMIVRTGGGLRQTFRPLGRGRNLAPVILLIVLLVFTVFILIQRDAYLRFVRGLRFNETCAGRLVAFPETGITLRATHTPEVEIGVFHDLTTPVSQEAVLAAIKEYAKRKSWLEIHFYSFPLDTRCSPPLGGLATPRAEEHGSCLAHRAIECVDILGHSSPVRALQSLLELRDSHNDPSYTSASVQGWGQNLELEGGPSVRELSECIHRRQDVIQRIDKLMRIGIVHGGIDAVPGMYVVPVFRGRFLGAPIAHTSIATKESLGELVDRIRTKRTSLVDAIDNQKE